MEEIVFMFDLREFRFVLGLERNFRIWMCGCGSKIVTAGEGSLLERVKERVFEV